MGREPGGVLGEKVGRSVGGEGGSPSLVLCEQRPETGRSTLSGSALGGGQERGSLLLVSIFKIQFVHSHGLNN